jgi:hypothetical protein
VTEADAAAIKEAYETGGELSAAVELLRRFPRRADVLAVPRNRCERAGRYPLATLIERHGRLYGVPGLLRALSAGCSRRRSISAAVRAIQALPLHVQAELGLSADPG